MCEECWCCVVVKGEGCACGELGGARCGGVISAKGRLVCAVQCDAWGWRAVRAVGRLPHGLGVCREGKKGLRHVARVANVGRGNAGGGYQRLL